jgi:hypothetical protein
MKLLLTILLATMASALENVRVPSTTHFDVTVTLGGSDLIANIKPGDTGVSAAITFLQVNREEYFPNDQEAYANAQKALAEHIALKIVAANNKADVEAAEAEEALVEERAAQEAEFEAETKKNEENEKMEAEKQVRAEEHMKEEIQKADEKEAEEASKQKRLEEKKRKEERDKKKEEESEKEIAAAAETERAQKVSF